MPISLVRRVFTSGAEDRGSSPSRVISKAKKMIVDTALLNTQHYKVRIKDKRSNPEKVVASFSISVVAIEKEDFGSLSTTVANFTLYLYI